MELVEEARVEEAEVDGVGDVEDSIDVVVVETNKLKSDECSSIVIGCAHIVMGPMTCVVLSLLSRIVTVVELVEENILVHPAYIALPFSMVMVV